MASIFKYSFGERMKLSKISKFLDSPIQTATKEEVIVATKRAIEKYPNDWVLYFFLGDYLQKAWKYAEAMPICQKIVELRPDDVRSPYCLATNYNLLTRAAITPEQWNMSQQYFQSEEVADPDTCRSELAKLGIDIQTAALQAIRWFERALNVKSDDASKMQIRQDLEVLYKRFPDLKA
jgi:tetratricopeptide (TPR) repeat protein